MKNLFLSLLLFPLFSMGQNLWTPIDFCQFKPTGERLISPSKLRGVSLDLAFLKTKLEAAPDWYTAQAAENQAVALEIPLPDSGFQTFKIWRADVLHPDLAARFPEIKSYAGHAKGDRSTSIRMDISPRGLYAMVLSAAGETFFIDPYLAGGTEHYQVYFKKDLPKKTGQNWVCHTTENGLRNLRSWFAQNRLICPFSDDADSIPRIPQLLKTLLATAASSENTASPSPAPANTRPFTAARLR